MYHMKIIDSKKTYLLCITWVLAKPVTLALDSDELMLTGPSPWKILIRFNFIGSIVSIASNPLMPAKNVWQICMHLDLEKCEKMNDFTDS